MMIRAKSGAPVLMDFGIAHIVDSETLTATGAVIGSPAHMAPEVVNGEPLTDRADLFSMGTVLYWMTCGSLPFVAPNPAALFRRILEARFDPIQSRRPEVLTAFADLVEQCMCRDPQQRPKSASFVANRLEELLAYSGLAEVDKTLSELSHDPSLFQAHLPQSLAPHYCESAITALNNHQLDMAQELIERAHRFDPESTKIQHAQQHIKRAMRKRRSVHFSLVSLCAAIFGAGVVIWLGNTFSTPAESVGPDIRSQSTDVIKDKPLQDQPEETQPSGTSGVNAKTPVVLNSSSRERPAKDPLGKRPKTRLDKSKRAQKKARLTRQSSQKKTRDHLKRRRAKRKYLNTKGKLSSLPKVSKTRTPQTSANSSKRVQRIKVSSRYKGVKVWVDGVAVGHIYQIDTAGGIDLTIGERHEIIFRSPFCEERRRSLMLERDLPKSPLVVFECAYKPATLIIHSQQDAEVFLDGPRPRLLGRTNQVITYPLQGTGANINFVIMNTQGKGTPLTLRLEAGQRREVKWP